MKNVGTFYLIFSAANAFRHPLWAYRDKDGQCLAHITITPKSVRIWNDIHAAERDPHQLFNLAVKSEVLHDIS